MSDDYTPTTEQVREAFRTAVLHPDDIDLDDAPGQEFDRYLAAHDAEIRETATREERWRCIALIRQRFGTANRAADWLDRLDREGAK